MHILKYNNQVLIDCKIYIYIYFFLTECSLVDMEDNILIAYFISLKNKKRISKYFSHTNNDR